MYFKKVYKAALERKKSQWPINIDAKKVCDRRKEREVKNESWGGNARAKRQC